MFRWLYLLVLCAGALGISVFVIPSEEELVLLQESHQAFVAAEPTFRLAQRAVGAPAEKPAEKVDPVEQEKLNQHTVFPLVRTHLQNGDVAAAEAALKELLEEQPQNLDALKLLARVYKEAQNTDDYIKTLETLVKLEPNERYSREISEHYSFVNKQKQIRHLQALVDRDSASKKELMQLAKLYAAEGQVERAIPLMAQALPEVGDQKNYKTLYALLDLLIENGDMLRTKNVAEDFISPKHVEASIAVLRYLFKKNARKVSYQLTLKLAKKEPYNPHVIEWEVDYLLAMKQTDEAINLMLKLAERRQLPTAMEKDLVSLVMISDKPHKLAPVLKVVTLKDLPPKVLVEVAQYCVDRKLSSEAHYIRLKLGDEYLSKQPLLSGLLKAGDKSIDLVTDKEEVSQLKTLSQEERVKLAQALHNSHKDGLSREVLSQDFSFRDVSQKDIIGVSETLISLGMEAKALTLLTQLHNPIEKAPLNSQIAWSYVAAANGRETQVLSWYQSAQNVGLAPRKRLHGFAQSRKLFKLAEVIAQDLYQAEPGEESRVRLVNAYLNNKSYGKAEPHLKWLAENKREDWEDDYVQLLEKLGKAGELKTYLGAKTGEGTLDAKKQRDIGHALVNSGDATASIGVFKELADGKGPKDLDTQQLLNLFGGEKLSEEGLSWIEAQTEAGSMAQKQAWLTHLLSIGYPKRVLKIVQNLNLQREPKISDLYLSALERARDQGGLQTFIAEEIDRKEDARSLEKLLKVAARSGSPALEMRALEKLSRINPNHPLVLRHQASQAFARKDYGAAKAFLDKAFAKGQEDVRSLYHYAEILRKSQSLEKSVPYYEKALQRLKKMPRKNIDFRVIEAKSLYFVGKKDESINRHKEILAGHKNNKSLRADIAHFYMDVGELNEAEAILGG